MAIHDVYSNLKFLGFFLSFFQINYKEYQINYCCYKEVRNTVGNSGTISSPGGGGGGGGVHEILPRYEVKGYIVAILKAIEQRASFQSGNIATLSTKWHLLKGILASSHFL